MSKAGSAAKVKLSSYDDLFGNAEEKTGSEEQIIRAKLTDLHEFRNHPFRVLDDEKMEETTESISKYGVLVPGIARPRAEGGYEIIAGHRRKRGSERAGKEDMPVIVRNYTDDEATIIMVDSNIQREDILPSEKAKAYAMKYEAMKHQGRKGNGNTLDEVGEAAGESGKTVQRYIWLARLSDELLELVDRKKIGLVLSMKNGWLDEENRAYIIYTLDNVMEDLGCAKATCVKIMKELDSDNGIGLIEKKRRGLGKPDIIYVKNFATIGEAEEETPANADVSTEVQDLNLKSSKSYTSRSSETELQEVQKADFQKSKNFTSRSTISELAEVQKADPNYTNYNHTNQSNIDRNYINPINQSGSELEGEIDVMEDVNAYMEIIKENIEYEHHMKYGRWQDKGLYEELYEVICEIVCVKHKTVKIGGNDYPYELVKSKFLKLNSSHLEYVIGCMQETTTKIANIKAYMVTALYNAPSTMNHYYQQEVQHDMYGGGWNEKNIG